MPGYWGFYISVLKKFEHLLEMVGVFIIIKSIIKIIIP